MPCKGPGDPPGIGVPRASSIFDFGLFMTRADWGLSQCVLFVIQGEEGPPSLEYIQAKDLFPPKELIKEEESLQVRKYKTQNSFGMRRLCHGRLWQCETQGWFCSPGHLLEAVGWPELWVTFGLAVSFCVHVWRLLMTALCAPAQPSQPCEGTAIHTASPLLLGSGMTQSSTALGVPCPPALTVRNHGAACVALQQVDALWDRLSIGAGLCSVQL